MVLQVFQYRFVIIFADWETHLVYYFQSHKICFTFLLDIVPWVSEVINEQCVKTCVLIVEKEKLAAHITKPDHLREVSC